MIDFRPTPALDPNLKLPLEVEYALTRMMVNDLQDYLSQLPDYPYEMP